MKEFKADKLTVKSYPTRKEMAEGAAADAVKALKEALASKDQINIIFAAAPSQSDFLEAVGNAEGIDWGRVNAYHMDEYVGLPADSEQSFVHYLKTNIWSKISLGSIHCLNSAVEDGDAESRRYSELLSKVAIDFVFMGIGENGHIAFNDPSVADFKDSKAVKVVELETSCRMQQVHDGCFPTLESVPQYAMTLTVPTLFSGKQLFCVVPTKLKAQAVSNALNGEISEVCPASILRNHPNAYLYLDADSASLL